MTKEELQEIKAAAAKIHENAAKRWSTTTTTHPASWEEHMMRLTYDIANITLCEAYRWHADPEAVDSIAAKGRKPVGSDYANRVLNNMEDSMALVALDAVDTIETFGKWRECKPYKWLPTIRLLARDGTVCGVPDLCYYLTEMALNPFQTTGGLLNILNALKWWCGRKGIDLRRHVELRMNYDRMR